MYPEPVPESFLSNLQTQSCRLYLSGYVTVLHQFVELEGQIIILLCSYASS